MKKALVCLRLALYGCKNRPFFYIVASHRKKPRNRGYFEQIGTYDPLPNSRNEKLVGLNEDRIKYWLSVGAQPTRTVSMLLGLAGILPIHPHTMEIAKRNREALSTAETTVTETHEPEEDEPEENQ